MKVKINYFLEFFEYSRTFTYQFTSKINFGVNGLCPGTDIKVTLKPVQAIGIEFFSLHEEMGRTKSKEMNLYL